MDAIYDILSLIGIIINKKGVTDMTNLKGTKTEANLMTAFAGESQARNKYTYYASTAKKKGISRLQRFLKKQPTMKKNTLRSGLKFYMMVKCRIL